MQTPDKPRLTRPVRRCGKFDKDFKTEALRMVAEGQPAATVARTLNVSEKLIYRWNREQKNQVGRQKAAKADEVDQLKAQLKRVEMERDILKKALIIFGPGGEPQPT